MTLDRVDGIPSLRGRRYALEAFAAGFDPTVDTLKLAWIAFADEISEPSGPGALRDMDWAATLAPDPIAVHWHGHHTVDTGVRPIRLVPRADWGTASVLARPDRRNEVAPALDGKGCNLPEIASFLVLAGKMPYGY